MAPTNPVRIRLRYPDLDTFVEKFAPNVTRGGVFLASRNITPVGSVIGFEIQLLNGEVVLAGQGKVTWVKEWNPAEPNRPYGMGVQFVSVEAATRPILVRLLRARETGGPAPRVAAKTGDFPPLAAATGAAAGPATGGALNGKPVAPPIDTSVDLGAEYGLPDAAIRRMIDRTWMTGTRGTDDLADLLKPDPIEPVTLAQALADLPRLLDPQYSRRRASGGFRPADAPASPTSMASTASTAEHMAPQAAVSETTDMTGASDTSETTDMTGASDASETTDMTGAADPVAAIEITDATDEADSGNGTGTGIPGDVDVAISMDAATGTAASPGGGHGRRGRKRRR